MPCLASSGLLEARITTPLQTARRRRGGAAPYDADTTGPWREMAGSWEGQA